MHNWSALLVCGPSRDKRSVVWFSPLDDVLKFNVDGAARGKPGPAYIGGVLRNIEGGLNFAFSVNVGMKESNEAEFLAILQALLIFFLFISSQANCGK